MSLVSLIVPSVSGSSLLSQIPLCPEVHSGPCAPGPARCLVRCAIPIFPSPRGASNDSVVSLFAYTYTCRRIYTVREFAASRVPDTTFGTYIHAARRWPWARISIIPTCIPAWTGARGDGRVGGYPRVPLGVDLEYVRM
ncbi:hypothetical protein OH76DRAFT_886751 [Lentinus brumalis]|uniref:Uncharacterized protein n=1 Tax=Lentinus brumalis TaxID=2498619 RepID=A0A371D1B6_9APHY|nr:hypothetical protein OH76DRAFT_886751 [Polyporus brumalis]